ncbi:MAG: hypothetical protein WCD86_14440 [Ktedonobacteraceae bacterium]|nr:hypothetical protein [Ktedonobacteraceae bacterium]
MSTYQEDTNYQLKRIREISNQVEIFYNEAVVLGDHAAHAFGGRSEHRSQMTGLETIANSTFKTSDVFDYVKKQTARHREWQQTYPDGGAPNDRFGERLLKQLQEDLAKKRDGIANRLSVGDKTDEDRLERRHIHLLLMREFIRKMVVQYEYASSSSNRRREG